MNIENKIAADELRSHKKLRDDMQVMAEKVARFDRLVKYLEDYANACDGYQLVHNGVYGWRITKHEAWRFLAECKELQK